MAEDEPKERKTATGEPAQGHHGAHETPDAPYGREVHINNEQAKHGGETPADDGEEPTGKPR